MIRSTQNKRLYFERRKSYSSFVFVIVLSDPLHQPVINYRFAAKYLQSIGVFPTSTKIDKVCQQYTLTKFQKQFSIRGQDSPQLGTFHHFDGAARIRRELDDGIAEIECRNRMRHSTIFKDSGSGLDASSRRTEAVIADSTDVQTWSARKLLGSQWRTLGVDEATQALLDARHNLVEMPRTSSKRLQMVRRELDSQATACVVVLLVHLARARLMRRFGFLTTDEQTMLELRYGIRRNSTSDAIGS